MKNSKSIMGVAIVTSFFLLGCGGGGSSGDSDGDGGGADTVSVNLKGADWAAYEASPWQAIDLTALENDTFTFTPDSSGKYGIAVHCAGDDNEISIYQFTRSEMAVSVAGCTDETQTASYSVTGTVSGATEGNPIFLSMSGASSVLPLGNGPYTLDNVSAGTRDLLGAELNMDMVPQKFAIDRDIIVDGNLTGKDLDFGSGYNTVPHTLSVTGGEGTAMFVSKNGSFGMIGSTDQSAWYAIGGGTISGDMYNFIAQSDDETKMIFQIKDAQNDPGNTTLDCDAITSYDSVLADGQLLTTYSGLNYLPAASSPEVRMYTLNQGQDATDVDHEIWVSKGWLGTATSYTLPDLSNLAGWNSSWGFQAGAQTQWEAMIVMANKSIYEATENMIDQEDGMPLFMNEGLEVQMVGQEGTFTP